MFTLTFRVLPKPPKVSISTTLHGPAYTRERLPIVITLENGEDETVALEIQYEPANVEDNQRMSSFHVMLMFSRLIFLAIRDNC